MYISRPQGKLIYCAVLRGPRWSKYLWSIIDRTTLDEQRVAAGQVPRRIRKQAYGKFWRLQQMELR